MSLVDFLCDYGEMTHVHWFEGGSEEILPVENLYR